MNCSGLRQDKMAGQERQKSGGRRLRVLKQFVIPIKMGIKEEP